MSTKEEKNVNSDDWINNLINLGYPLAEIQRLEETLRNDPDAKEVLLKLNETYIEPPEPPEAYREHNSKDWDGSSPDEPIDYSTLLKSYADVKEEETEYYWYPFFRKAGLNAITAIQGTGKSMLACKMMAMASIGKRMELPFQDLYCNYTPFSEPENSLFLNVEDDPAQDTKGRLKVCGANDSYIHYVDVRDLNVNFYNPCIETWIQQVKATAVFFDPVQYFFNGKDPKGCVLDMNNSASVRPALTHLNELGRRHNCAIFIICHPNKNPTSALYGTAGSNDFTACPRAAVYIGRNPEDREERILASVKANSVREQHQKSLAYRIDFVNGGVVFCGESDLKADDITSSRRHSKTPKEQEGERAEKPPNKTERAQGWLESVLMSNGGYMAKPEIITAAQKADIAIATLDKAKAKMPSILATGKGGNRVVYWYIEGHEDKLPPEQAEIC